jgi:ATP-binding cassette subfamily B protein
VLRDAIGIVPQDTVVFSANAMENIRYGRDGASDEEVIARPNGRRA